MLRRLRFELYSREPRFPLRYFRRVSAGEIVQMINPEAKPPGGFIAQAFVRPAFQGGTLPTILTFMFVQDRIMGAAAIVLYPFQIYGIPKLPRQVNLLGKARVGQVCARVARESGVIFRIRYHQAARGPDHACCDRPLDPAEQLAILGRLLEGLEQPTLIWALNRSDWERKFDHVLSRAEAAWSSRAGSPGSTTTAARSRSWWPPNDPEPRITHERGSFVA
jgi:hypothetical protein